MTFGSLNCRKIWILWITALFLGQPTIKPIPIWEDHEKWVTTSEENGDLDVEFDKKWKIVNQITIKNNEHLTVGWLRTNAAKWLVKIVKNKSPKKLNENKQLNEYAALQDRSKRSLQYRTLFIKTDCKTVDLFGDLKSWTKLTD